MIAFISDIHANSLALYNVLKDIKDRKVKIIYCNGDVCGYGPWPEKCLKSVRDDCESSIKGNHDHFQSEGYSFHATRSSSGNTISERSPLINHTDHNDLITYYRWSREKDMMSDESIAFLKQLKHDDVIQARKGGKTFNIYMCHGSPDDMEKYMFTKVHDGKPEGPDEIFDDLLEKASKIKKREIHSVILGHTHRAFIKKTKKGVVANAGSVGLPRDGDPRASYLLWTPEKQEIIRVEYDIEVVIKDMKDTGFQDYANQYEIKLRNAT